eukprot:gene1416-2714_t
MSVASDVGNIIFKSWTKAVKQTMYEQSVEDENALHKMDNHLVRRLIAMPLTEAFNPSQISAMHCKVQYGDKCSLPGSIGRAIFEKPYEVPWIFEMKPVKRSGTNIPSGLHNQQGRQLLEKAYISPLDFRAPENYIFLPQWLMSTMGLSPNDLVDVSFVRLKLASLITLQPLTIAWDKLMIQTKNPRTILEHEVNKYSSLTAGSTILIEFEGVEYPLYVQETKAEGGVAIRGVRVQDSDVRVDIDRSVLDKILQEQKEKEMKEKELKEKIKK